MSNMECPMLKLGAALSGDLSSSWSISFFFDSYPKRINHLDIGHSVLDIGYYYDLLQNCNYSAGCPSGAKYR